MATITQTRTFHAAGYDANRSVFRDTTTISSFSNFIGQAASSTNYADINLITGSNAETFFWVTFDFSEIPADATINSVTITTKCLGSGNATYVGTKQVRAYVSESTTKGYSSTITTSVQTLELNLGTGTTWTRQQLDDLELRYYLKRKTTNTTTNYYLRLYGVDVVVEYEYEEPSEAIYVKESGSWTSYSKAYKKINGSWVEQTDLTTVFDTETNYVKSN
mgnify:CR=1 FL=1